MMIVEPPVVRPDLYKPALLDQFDAVLSIARPREIPEASHLHYCYPTHREVHRVALDSRKLVAVFNNRKLPAGHREVSLYAERERAIQGILTASGGVAPDVFGHGWEMVPTWRGYVEDKIEALSHYLFCVCYENAIWPGWVTEKIADCFYAGSIPLYLGAPDIDKYVPRQCYVDARDFDDYASMYRYMVAAAQNPAETKPYLSAIDAYLASSAFDSRFTSVAFAEVLKRACFPEAALLVR